MHLSLLLPFQDDDSDMLCLQPAHFVSPGGPGVAGWKRLGRYGQRAGEL